MSLNIISLFFCFFFFFYLKAVSVTMQSRPLTYITATVVPQSPVWTVRGKMNKNKQTNKQSHDIKVGTFAIFAITRLHPAKMKAFFMGLYIRHLVTCPQHTLPSVPHDLNWLSSRKWTDGNINGFIFKIMHLSNWASRTPLHTYT